jgi:hypothetical protein
MGRTPSFRESGNPGFEMVDIPNSLDARFRGHDEL